MTEASVPPRVPPTVPVGRRAASRCARFLGILSLLVFFVPLLAPLIQVGTLVFVLFAAWRGVLDRTGVIIGAAGSALGFVLFLATEFIWVV